MYRSSSLKPSSWHFSGKNIKTLHERRVKMLMEKMPSYPFHHFNQAMPIYLSVSSQTYRMTKFYAKLSCGATESKATLSFLDTLHFFARFQ